MNHCLKRSRVSKQTTCIGKCDLRSIDMDTRYIHINALCFKNKGQGHVFSQQDYTKTNEFDVF